LILSGDTVINICEANHAQNAPVVRSRGMVMPSKNRFMCSIVTLGLAAITQGCNREPPLSQPPPVEVVISQPITNEKIEDWDIFTGTVEPKESVDIRARVRGEIMQVLFTEGEEFTEEIDPKTKEKKLRLLFVIDDAPFQADLKQAQGQLKTWQAKKEAADKSVAIYEPLAKKGTISQRELVDAIGLQGEAVGGIETSRGKIFDAETNIKYCKIYSPIAGKIGQALLTKGNIVNSGGQENLLTTVVSVDPVYVYFYVTERAFLNYQAYLQKKFEKDKKADKPVIPAEMALQTDSGFPHKGVIDFVDNRVDKSTGTFKVRGRFDNPKGPDGRRKLTAGLFARVRVSIGDAYAPILVADRAILTDQSLKYVLVVNKVRNNVVERVDVRASSRLQEDGLRAVEGGLKGDEWVIVDGVNRARPGMPVTPMEGKMPRRPIGAK
jgi:multidrug efflux system membrane fusion protein